MEDIYEGDSDDNMPPLDKNLDRMSLGEDEERE